MREHANKGAFVEGLTLVPVQNTSQIKTLLTTGNKQRTTAATDMNATSSRSHAIFTLHITYDAISKEKIDGTQIAGSHDDAANREEGSIGRATSSSPVTTRYIAKASLVDLAGSERAKMTGCTG